MRFLPLLICLLLLGAVTTQASDARRHHALAQRSSMTTSNGSMLAEDASAHAIQERGLPALRFPYSGGKKVRGVSLGGWLVVEYFITPSVYGATGHTHIVDEWSFGSLQSRKKAVSILSRHLNSFITEADFRKIAAAGLNHVRIPIGYWAFDVNPGEPYLKLNQWSLLKQACGWAAKYNLRVLIDLHAAPGNQNGFDHGGHRNVNQWANSHSNVRRTIEILRTMSREFSQKKYANSVAAIELLNEPISDHDVVLRFYEEAYEAVRYPHGRDSPESPLLVVIGDEFMNPAYSRYWHDKLRPPAYEGVAVDSHLYTVFSMDVLQFSVKQRLDYYCSLKHKWAKANNDHYQLLGEWTPAITDCAHGLNGRGIGSRYDGSFEGSPGRIGSCATKSGNAAHFSKDYKKQLARFWEAQASAGEGGIGWLMWTWKTEAHRAEDWSYEKGLEYGWIPQDPSKRPHGIHC